MATSIPVERDDEQISSTTAAAPTAADSTGHERSLRRETILLMALVGLVVAVVLFGLVFPELLAPAVALPCSPLSSRLTGCFLPETATDVGASLDALSAL